jgi:hypothetical protein
MVPSGDGVGGAAGGWLTTAAGVPPWEADIMRVRVDKQNCSQQNAPGFHSFFVLLLLCTYMEYVRVVSRKCKRYGG